MTKQEILEKVATTFESNAICSVNQIKLESNFLEELNLTSLELLVLVGELEEVFNIHFEYEDLINIVTVDDLVQAIMKQLQP